MRHRIRAALLIAVLVLAPAAAFAQTLGTIAGSVKDASGAVLPGVTVEAASPALIEKVRTVATDGTGLYRIVNLPPGAYTVTFTLPGFNTVRREGVEVSSASPSTIDARSARRRASRRPSRSPARARSSTCSRRRRRAR